MGNNQFRHAMDHDQLESMVGAINDASTAIHNIHVHATHIQKFAKQAGKSSAGMEAKSSYLLAGLLKLRETIHGKADTVIVKVLGAGQQAGRKVEEGIRKLESVDVNNIIDDVKRNMIFVIVPLIVLILEIIISTAYLALIVATLPGIEETVKHHLVIGALVTATGFLISLIWFSVDRAVKHMRYYQLQQLRRREKFDKMLRKLKAQAATGEAMGLDLILQDKKSLKHLQRAGSLHAGLASVHSPEYASPDKSSRRMSLSPVSLRSKKIVAGEHGSPKAGSKDHSPGRSTYYSPMKFNYSGVGSASSPASRFRSASIDSAFFPSMSGSIDSSRLNFNIDSSAGLHCINLNDSSQLPRAERPHRRVSILPRFRGTRTHETRASRYVKDLYANKNLSSWGAKRKEDSFHRKDILKYATGVDEDRLWAEFTKEVESLGVSSQDMRELVEEQGVDIGSLSPVSMRRSPATVKKRESARQEVDASPTRHWRGLHLDASPIRRGVDSPGLSPSRRTIESHRAIGAIPSFAAGTGGFNIGPSSIEREGNHLSPGSARDASELYSSNPSKGRSEVIFRYPGVKPTKPVQRRAAQGYKNMIHAAIDYPHGLPAASHKTSHKPSYSHGPGYRAYTRRKNQAIAKHQAGIRRKTLSGKRDDSEIPKAKALPTFDVRPLVSDTKESAVLLANDPVYE